MKRLLILCLTFCMGWGVASASLRDSIGHALRELDGLIERRSDLRQDYEHMLDSLKRKMKSTTDVNEKYQLCGSLFYYYLHYQADSSLYYIGKKEALLPQMNRPDLQGEIHVNRAEVLLVAGKLSEARQELEYIRSEKTEKGLRQYYYGTYCNYYIWQAGLTVDNAMRKRFYQQANNYRDSVLRLMPPGVNHDIVYSNLLLKDGNADRIIRLLERQLKVSKDSKERTNLHYNLSEAYAFKGDTLRQVYHLAQTAILDIKSCVREYMALPTLAWMVYNLGDIERAYVYANCSLEDAAACNSHLRADSGKFISIIQGTMAEKVKRDYIVSRRTAVVFGAMLMLLIITAAFLVRWMKELAKTRRLLEEANDKLAISNQELIETGKVKDAYLQSYMYRCVYYLETMDKQRRALEKLAMAHKTAELFQSIKSDAIIVEERKKLYEEFDRSFLELFPSFVEDINDLLCEDGKLVPKQGEQLGTELRVMALIRLGVTDTARIARFLNCSLTTVYNYRSRIRNRAKGDKSTFEDQVMGCG